MKRNTETVEIQVKPKRLSRAERRSAKLAEKVAAELELCRQNVEFHKAYLTVEYDVEEAYHDALQKRIADLQSGADVTEVVEEEEDMFTTLAREEDEFSE